MEKFQNESRNDLCSQLNGCVVIPAFCEEKKINNVVREVLNYIKNVIVVDDGSKDRTAEEANNAGAIVVKHSANLGKGMALITGFKWALEKKYGFIITMDADGQHSPADLKNFLETYQQLKCDVIIGNRMNNPQGMPLVRKLTNHFMSWYLSRLMGQIVPDTQNGYRLYSAKVLPIIAESQSSRFAAESEVLLKLAVRGIRIESVPVTVIYSDEKSKINPIKDTIRFMKMIYRFKKMIKEEAGSSMPTHS
jgi:glycosyltransferase involved in cell wall biosynthesis